MEVFFTISRPTAGDTVRDLIEFNVEDGIVYGYNQTFKGPCRIIDMSVASNLDGSFEVEFVNTIHREFTFDDLMNIARAIVDTESNLPKTVSICRNAVASLSDKKFIVTEYKDGTKKLAVISDDKVYKFDLAYPEFTVFGLDLYVFEYGKSQYGIMSPVDQVQSNDRIIVLKAQISDGLHDLRQDKYMRDICKVIQKKLIDTVDISIEKKYSGIHLAFRTIARTIIKPSDSKAYEQLKYMCGSYESIELSRLETIANETDSKNLKNFITRIHNNGYKFNLAQFDAYGTTYSVIISGPSNTDRVIVIKRNMCYVTQQASVEKIISINNVLIGLNNLKDPHNAIVYYPNNGSISKMPALEFIKNCTSCKHILYFDQTNDMYAYMEKEGSAKKHGKCKLLEMDNENVLVFATNEVLLYTPNELKVSTTLDKNDYEYFVSQNAHT